MASYKDYRLSPTTMEMIADRFDGKYPGHTRKGRPKKAQKVQLRLVLEYLHIIDDLIGRRESEPSIKVTREAALKIVEDRCVEDNKYPSRSAFEKALTAFKITAGNTLEVHRNYCEGRFEWQHVKHIIKA